MLKRDRHDALLEAVEMRVHDVERHLHGVEAEAVPVGRLEHVAMDRRALVAGEADVADLALLARPQHGLQRAAWREHALGIVHADDLVELQQVDVIGLQALQRFLDLRIAAVAVRPSILVMRNARSR